MTQAPIGIGYDDLRRVARDFSEPVTSSIDRLIGVIERHQESWNKFALIPVTLASGITASPPTTVLDGRRVDFYARSIEVDNPSGYTLFIPQLQRSVPPTTYGYSVACRPAVTEITLQVVNGTQATAVTALVIASEKERETSGGAVDTNTGGGGTASNVAITGPLGQATMAASIPVVIASNQSAEPVTQSGAWNVGLNAGANAIGTVAVNAALPAGGNTIGNVGVVNGANQQQVDADSKAYVVDLAAINVANAQQTSTAAAATLLAARATRKRATIRNLDAANSVWLGVATVTTANGFILKAGESRDYFGKVLLQIIDNGAHAAVDVVDYYD